MPECEDCGSDDVAHEDSHWSYVSATERTEVHYYSCNDCGEKFATNDR